MAIEDRHIEDLKERFENLTKELELVKQSSSQGISYVPPEKSNKGNLDDIVNNVENRKDKKGKKKEDCHCNCFIY